MSEVEGQFAEVVVLCDKSAVHKARQPFTLGSFRYWSNFHGEPVEHLEGWWFSPRPGGDEVVTELAGDVPVESVNPFQIESIPPTSQERVSTRAAVHLECKECGRRGAVDLRAETLVPILNRLRDAGVSSLTLATLAGIVQNRS